MPFSQKPETFSAIFIAFLQPKKIYAISKKAPA